MAAAGARTGRTSSLALVGAMATSEERDALLEKIELQRVGFVKLGCPFYDEFSALLAADVAADGPTTALLEPHGEHAFEQMYMLRLLGGVHRCALDGTSPALAAHFPSTGGDGDAAAAFAAFLDLLATTPDALGDWDARPPQTNEVGRSAALASGLLVVAAELGMPLSIREIGSSAGLNLRLDQYWYEQDGVGWGDPGSAVRFVDLWNGGAPPFTAGAEIADRRGCDPDPVDATSADGALTLMSYIWPEPAARFERARGAIAQAPAMPVTIDDAGARDWVPEQLADRPTGTALVVMHSVMWQYLDDATRDAIRSSLADAGRVATAEQPVVWVRLEPHAEDFYPAELRATIWDGQAPEGRERLLATTGFHGGELDWVADDAT